MAMIGVSGKSYKDMSELAIKSIIGEITGEELVDGMTNILEEEEIHKEDIIEIVAVNDNSQKEYIGKKVK